MSGVLGICCDGFIDRLNTLLVSTRISVGYAFYLGSIAVFFYVAKQFDLESQNPGRNKSNIDRGAKGPSSVFAKTLGYKKKGNKVGLNNIK